MYVNEFYRRSKDAKGISLELCLSCDKPDDILFILGRYLMIPSSNRDERARIDEAMSTLIQDQPLLIEEGFLYGWDVVLREFELSLLVSAPHRRRVQDYLSDIMSRRPHLVASTFLKWRRTSTPSTFSRNCISPPPVCPHVSTCKLSCPLKSFVFNDKQLTNA